MPRDPSSRPPTKNTSPRRRQGCGRGRLTNQALLGAPLLRWGGWNPGSLTPHSPPRLCLTFPGIPPGVTATMCELEKRSMRASLSPQGPHPNFAPSAPQSLSGV